MGNVMSGLAAAATPGVRLHTYCMYLLGAKLGESSGKNKGGTHKDT